MVLLARDFSNCKAFPNFTNEKLNGIISKHSIHRCCEETPGRVHPPIANSARASRWSSQGECVRFFARLSTAQEISVQPLICLHGHAPVLEPQACLALRNRPRPSRTASWSRHCCTSVNNQALPRGYTTPCCVAWGSGLLQSAAHIAAAGGGGNSKLGFKKHYFATKTSGRGVIS